MARLPKLLQQELVLVETDAAGSVRRATALQVASALDDLYQRAAALPDLGVSITPQHTQFKLWAPTAQQVALCLYANGQAPAHRLVALQRDGRTGAWSARLPGNLSGHHYTYLVDVHARGAGLVDVHAPSAGLVEVQARGAGLVRNRVTDPYAISLNTDSRRSWVGSLNAAALQPAGWATTPRPDAVQTSTDLVVYELHLRDFSVNDTTVPAVQRGKYLAFTHPGSTGMQHLRALAAAGLTDVHLLPVFDFASVPEQGCTTPDVVSLAALPPDSEAQQALVMAGAAQDCFKGATTRCTSARPKAAMPPTPKTAPCASSNFAAWCRHCTAPGCGWAWTWSTTTPVHQARNSTRCWTVPCPATTSA